MWLKMGAKVGVFGPGFYIGERDAVLFRCKYFFQRLITFTILKKENQ